MRSLHPEKPTSGVQRLGGGCAQPATMATQIAARGPPVRWCGLSGVLWPVARGALYDGPTAPTLTACSAYTFVTYPRRISPMLAAPTERIVTSSSARRISSTRPTPS